MIVVFEPHNVASAMMPRHFLIPACLIELIHLLTMVSALTDESYLELPKDGSPLPELEKQIDENPFQLQ